MECIPEDQERDREEFYGTPITALLEPVSCKVCKVVSHALGATYNLENLQGLVNLAGRHVNRHHSYSPSK